MLEQKKKAWGSIVLFGLILLLLGQKAGLLYFIIIFTVGVVTARYLQWGIISSCLVIVFSAKLWFPYIVKLSPFWENVYNKHGAWGVLLSLRNENIENIWGIISPPLSVFDVIFGGVIRFPTQIEMMPFDILIFFGVLGILLFVLLVFKILPSWKWSIPIFVACFGVGIYEAPLGMLLFFLIVALVRKGSHNYSP